MKRGLMRLSPVWGRAILLLVCASACAPAQAPKSSAPRDYDGPVLDSRNIAGDFVWEQQITAHYGPLSQSFGAVIQSADDELTVLGLTPFNTRAFSIQQRGVSFVFTNYVHQSLPFRPRNILIDIHRTFFVGVPEAAPPDGEHQHVALGERRVDVWHGGRLMRRSFERLSDPGTRIEIDYGPGYAPGAPPPHVTFKNGYYGYSLDVDTTNVTSLESTVQPH